MAEPEVVRHVEWRNGGKPVGVLPAAAVYGANGSGKSNVLRALYDMRSHVLFSFRQFGPDQGFPRRAFRLGDGAASPSRFEVDLVIEGVRHEYGFVVDDERVLEEWAIHYPQGRNALFLSVDAAVRQPALSSLSGWFARNLLLAEADSRSRRQALTTKMLEEDATRESVLALLRAADLGISGANRVEVDPVMRERFRHALRILDGAEAAPESGSEDEPEFEAFQVRLEHEGAHGPVEFDADEESLGTLVWFGLVGPILQSLARGSVLLADELDSSLHPDLVAALVALYQDPSVNRRRAQLIFNLHDATLLGDSSEDRPLGRDQVWFTEKNKDGGSHLYPLADLDPRRKEAVARRYLAGRYGGKPIILRAEFAEAVERITSGGSR